MKVNKYLIVTKDYDNFTINIVQDVNRPNNPDDYEIIMDYMRNNLMGSNYEIVDLRDIELFETVEL